MKAILKIPCVRQKAGGNLMLNLVHSYSSLVMENALF